MEIDKKAFEYAIKKIDDGYIFENFGLNFLSAVQGHDFIPVGGTKDKGVDGYQHIYSRENNQKIVYQLSTEQTFESKLCDTLEKLKRNNVTVDRLYYVTNRKLYNTDKVVEDLYDRYKTPISIMDVQWFVSNANHILPTIRAYQAYVDTYLHEFTRPGKTQVVANLDSDSRLYVFLSQQFNSRTDEFKLDDLLADTLILYALEGTDPDIEIFKTRNEIKEAIKKYIKFDPQLLEKKINERLETLSTKPRKINFHPDRGYCLITSQKCHF